MSGPARTTAVRRWAAAVACALALAGCADDPSPPSPEESAVDPSASTSPEPSTPATPVPGADSAVAQQAVTDLAGSLDVDPAEVEVVAVEEVAWNDGSLGCAKPGMMYTQSIVEGSRVTLRVDGTTYEYHSGGSRPPFLCENPTG